MCQPHSKLVSQVLCPRCEFVNEGSPKRKPKKGKESLKSNKKKTPRLSTLSDVEKVLSEVKDSTSAVSVIHLTHYLDKLISKSASLTAKLFYCLVRTSPSLTCLSSHAAVGADLATQNNYSYYSRSSPMSFRSINVYAQSFFLTAAP